MKKPFVPKVGDAYVEKGVQPKEFFEDSLYIVEPAPWGALGVVMVPWGEQPTRGITYGPHNADKWELFSMKPGQKWSAFGEVVLLKRLTGEGGWDPRSKQGGGFPRWEIEIVQTSNSWRRAGETTYHMVWDIFTHGTLLP